MKRKGIASGLTLLVALSVVACRPASPPPNNAPPPPAQASKASDEVVLGGDPADSLLKAGTQAPDFTLTLKGGKQFVLKEALAKGKVLLLNFWGVT